MAMAKSAGLESAAQCDFKGPARFQDMIQISVGVQRIGRRSVTYAFSLSCEDRPVAEGTMTSACCFVTQGQLEAIDIPKETRLVLEQYLI